MPGLLEGLRGQGILARAARGAGVTAAGFVAAQGLRLASNLILTRLLFPEAFGLLALMTLFLAGLTMFSDIGLGPSIAQSRRGDDPDFLDTAWTVQVIRGVLLWLLTCLLAWPAAAFYGAPDLAWMLPAAGLSLLIAGFTPTKVETAARHLRLGRVVALDLLAQLVGILAMVGLAAATGSVWALVAGGLVGAVARLALMRRGLPGPGNRLRWDRTAVAELIGFGKWIFLSTMLGFLITQGDKAILGRFLPLAEFGIYNIGALLASVPMLLGGAVVGRVLIPVYRETPPEAPPAALRRLRRMRAGLTGGLMALVCLFAFGGVALVELLYDPRYHAAGAVVVAIALTQLVQVIGLTYDQAALAAGDSRRFFLLFAARAAVQLGCFAAGLVLGGLPGALVGLGLAMLAAHPMIILLARRHRVWDPVHDAAYAGVALAAGAAAAWANLPALRALAAFGAS